MAAVTTTARHPDGVLEIHELGGGARRVEATLFDPDAFLPHAEVTTRYSPELIERILAVKGPAWALDEILREESPQRVELAVRATLLSHVEAARFRGARILDFGCGSGASTSVLGRIFPDSEVVGVELDPELLELARLRAEHYGNEAVRFEASPSPEEVPAGLGTFDFLYLSAVWEHLLPRERRTLPRTLWGLLRPGGVLFVTETPHRWFPWETHTTGLPLINYLPDGWAERLARRSARVGAEDSWDRMLRNGLRGGTVGEILRVLRAGDDGDPLLLPPLSTAGRDEAELWYRKGDHDAGRRMAAAGFRLVERAGVSAFLPYLNVAILKR